MPILSEFIYYFCFHTLLEHFKQKLLVSNGLEVNIIFPQSGFEHRYTILFGYFFVKTIGYLFLLEK